MALGWKDWLAGCSFALTAGVIAGTLHVALGQPAAPPATPGSNVVLPAPEDNAQLSRTAKVGSTQVGRQAGSGGGVRPGQADPVPAAQQPGGAAAPAGKAPKTVPARGAPAPKPPGRPGATTTPSAPSTPTDPGPPPGPGASDPPASTAPAPPTGSGLPTDPGGPTGSTG